MKVNDIIGHKDKIAMMIKAYEHKRLAHAYIFHGPEGVGKKAAALALIKYIFCDDSSFKEDHGDSCSVCASCRKLENGNHPDLIMVQPERSVIKIDMIRELKKKLHFGKYDAALRFIIIDEAEKLRVEAANALLKTLEEPSGDAVIILVTSKVNMLLPTIVSRCQKIRFNPLDPQEIKSELINKYDIESDEADIVAAFFKGSVAELEKTDFSDIIELRRKLVKKIKDVSLNNFSGIIDFSNETGAQDKELLVEMIEIIKTFYRDAVMLKSEITDNIINKDIMADIKRLASDMTRDELFFKINILNHMQSLLMANINKRLLVESMLIELCA